MLEISADDEESRKIAEINPLRYRGYYYDNETGYYYLQSRYYDPDLGRFISADDFNYLNTNNKLSINAYIYCNNNPTSKYDSDGHEALALGVLIGFMCEAVVYSLLLLVLCMVLPVIIGLVGEIDLDLPNISLPSKQKQPRLKRLMQRLEMLLRIIKTIIIGRLRLIRVDMLK